MTQMRSNRQRRKARPGAGTLRFANPALEAAFQVQEVQFALALLRLWAGPNPCRPVPQGGGTDRYCFTKQYPWFVSRCYCWWVCGFVEGIFAQKDFEALPPLEGFLGG